MVLDVPVKTGNQVIESNNFNDGTTIATLADVDKMIFEGKVDESEVGKIKEGLPLEITVGAIEDEIERIHQERRNSQVTEEQHITKLT
mgnify:CR=1 FL=1